MPAPCSIRRAIPSDGPHLLRLIRALATFEKLPPPDAAAEQRLLADGFGPRPRFECWLASVAGVNEPIGYALLFETYSTFLARPTLFLEDLFVLETHRGRGIGSALLEHCIHLADERGCGRMEWFCLDWNRRAQQTYETRGARHLREWMLYRLTEFGPNAGATNSAGGSVGGS